jgi:hypothetical protein
LPFIDDLIDRKLGGPEKSQLPEADLAFHETQYQQHVEKLKAASAASKLPELPAGKEALNDLLVRLRLTKVGE